MADVSDPTEEEETPFLMVEAMPIYSFALGIPNRSGDMLFSDPRRGLDSFIEAVNLTKPGDYNTAAVPTSVANRITEVLSSNPRLLNVGFGDCDTLWRWLVKNDYFRICLFISYLYRCNKWEIPINAVDPITGDSVLTDHRFIPSPKMLHMLITTGESMDFHNAKTIENMLHILVKKRPENPDSNTAYNLLNFIVKSCETIENPYFSYLNNLPDIDLPNYQNKSPLQIALESGWMEMAELLVEKLGADFNYVSCVSLPGRSVNYVEQCKSLYTIKSNVTEIDEGDEDEKECRLCSEAMEPSEAYRLVGCCKKMMHSECLRKYLNRTNNPTCIFCNVSKIEEDVLAAIPNTVFKSKWTRARTYSEAVTARETAENASDFLEEIVATHEDLSMVLQWHIPSAEYEDSSAPETPRSTPVIIFGSYGIDGVNRFSPSIDHIHRYSTIRMEDHIVYRNMVTNFENENVSINIAKIYRQEYLSIIAYPGAYKCITGETMARLLLDINGLVETADTCNSDGFDRFVEGVSSCLANSCFRPYNVNLARDKLMQYIRRSLIERAQRNILIRFLSVYQEGEFMDRLRGVNTISVCSRNVWMRFREEHVSNICDLFYLYRSILSIGPIVGGSDQERTCFTNNWLDDMVNFFSLVCTVVETLVK